MRRVAGLAVVACFALMTIGSRPGHSGDVAVKAQAAKAVVAQAEEKPATAKEDKPAAKKPKGRLPGGYGKLGLSGEQRRKIYGIQDSYRDRIEELERQLDALKEQRDAEIVAVLTPEQKQTLEAQLKEKEAKKQQAKVVTTEAKAIGTVNPEPLPPRGE